MLAKSILIFGATAAIAFGAVAFGHARQAQGQTPQLAACPSGATLAVSSPVAAAPTTVSALLLPPQNIKAATQADPASLHLHYFIDTDPTAAGQTIPSGNPKIIHSALLSQDLGTLSAGPHTVWVVLGQLDHTACSTRGVVNFTYAPEASLLTIPAATVASVAASVATSVAAAINAPAGGAPAVRPPSTGDAGLLVIGRTDE